MNPSLCPLCRKAFLPERSKKLITADLDIPEVDWIEDKKAIELLTKLVDSLDTEGCHSTILEVDMWLSAGNTHALLQKAHQVLKEYLLLKSESSAHLRLIRRLQREMHCLQVDKSTEKKNASAMEQELLSQIEALQKKVRKLEERPRIATKIAFNHNPLPTPPEPFPLESLPFFANFQQKYNLPNEISPQNSLDPNSHSTGYLSGESSNPKVEGLAAAPSTEKPSIPSDISSSGNAIIPGASPNQRYIPRTMLEDFSNSARASINEQSALQIDPFALATDYFVEYAAGYQEGYQLSHRHMQSLSRHKRQERRTESVVPSAAESPSQSSSSSSSTLDDRSIQQLADLSTTNQPVRRTLELRYFYRIPTSFSPHGADDSAPAPRVSSPGPSTSNYSSSSHDEHPWVPSNWPTLPTMSTSPTLMEPPATFAAYRSSHLSSALTPQLVSVSDDSRQIPSPPLTSAPPSRAASIVFSNAGSSRSSRASSLSRPPERLGSDRRSVEILWDSESEFPAPNIPDARPRRRSAVNNNSSLQSAPRLRVDDSPASARTMESWGTVSTGNSHLVFQQPFIPAHQIASVSDLGLARFSDIYSSHAGTGSQRSSSPLDVASPSSPSHIGFQASVNVGTYGRDSQNRTPRVAPRPLPGTESMSSLEDGSSYYWDPSTTHFFHHDPRQRTSRPSSAANHNSSTSMSRETSLASMNALGLTDLTPSTGPRISAPTPITPSQSFLLYYN